MYAIDWIDRLDAVPETVATNFLEYGPRSETVETLVEGVEEGDLDSYITRHNESTPSDGSLQ